MHVIITFHTADYRGDHAADVCRAVEYQPGETIEELCDRCNIGKNQYAVGENIQIRIVEISAIAAKEKNDA